MAAALEMTLCALGYSGNGGVCSNGCHCASSDLLMTVSGRILLLWYFSSQALRDPSARLLGDAVLGIAASLEVVILRGPGQDVSRDLLAVSDRAVIHGSRHAQAPEALVRRRADRIHAGAGKRQRPTDGEKRMHAR